MLVEGGWTLPATGDKRRVSDRVTVPKAKTLGPATVPYPRTMPNSGVMSSDVPSPGSTMADAQPRRQNMQRAGRRSSFPPAQGPPRPNHQGSLLAARSGWEAKMKSAATLTLIPAAGAHLLLGLVHAARARPTPPPHVC